MKARLRHIIGISTAEPARWGGAYVRWVGANAPTRLRIGAPKRAQTSGGAVAGGCRCNRGWTGVSLLGEEGEVFQPTTAKIAVGPVEIETSAAAP